jgi:teichuronic acid biosynthesis glycosyltransferase TuaC
VAIPLGKPIGETVVIGNGVDLGKFFRRDKFEARARLNIPKDAKVIIGVGGLIARKGFHRVIPLIPELVKRYSDLKYLIVGGGFSQGDMHAELVALAKSHGVEKHVIFCGAQPTSELSWYYSAADSFVLATEHEGWANVFLEAMACGLPVVTTLVGGNTEVVKSQSIGLLSPFWNPEMFLSNISASLERVWDRHEIVNYALANQWDRRIDALEQIFFEVLKERS